MSAPDFDVLMGIPTFLFDINLDFEAFRIEVVQSKL